MDNLKTATVLSKADWDQHVIACEELHDVKHKGIIGKAVVVSVDTSCPQIPFLCYSLYTERAELDHEPEGEWLHFCFVPGEAAWILANADEDAAALKELHAETLKKDRPARLKALADDLAMDDEEEPDENLGTIGG